MGLDQRVCTSKVSTAVFFSFLIFCLDLQNVTGLKFETEPTSVLVLSSGRSVFKCSADNADALIRWKQDGRFIQHDASQGIQISDNKLIVKAVWRGSTVIRSLTSAIYQCIISYQHVTLASQYAKLIVAELLPFPIQEDVVVRVSEGNIAVIPCQPPYSVPVAITEFKFNNNTIISKSTDKFILLPSGNLHIINTQKSNQGSYVCIVNNPFLGYKNEAYHKVHLKVTSSSSNKDIKFTVRPKRNVGAVTGSNLTIECAAEGSPPPNIVWIKRKGVLPERRHRIKAGNLLIFNVQTEDAGTYSCVAGNDGASHGVSSVVTLDINEIPEVTDHTAHTYAREKSVVRLRCVVTGHPRPRIMWLHDGQLLQRNKSVSIRYNTLTLNSFASYQAGAYQCFASNDLGSSYRTIVVDSLISKPNEDSKNVNKKVSAGDAKYTDKEAGRTKNNKGKKHQRKKGRGKKRRKNKNRKVVDKSRPKSIKMVTPTRPEITKLSDHSVMVRWDLLKNDGLPIRFYKLQYKDVSRTISGRPSGWKTIPDPGEIKPHVKSYEVLDLETDHVYRFRVVAVYSNNDNKFGPNSYKFRLQKDPPMKKPVGAPTIINAKPISSSAVEISWEYKESLDSVQVDGYFIYYRSGHTAGDYTKMTVLGANTRIHIIDHLLPNTPYDIKMQCFNMAGASDFSNIYSEKTNALGNTTSETEDEIDDSDSAHVNVPSDTDKSSQLLYMVLGIALSIMFLVLVVFIIVCSIKQRNEPQSSEFDHRIHSKYLDTSAHIHETHHMNGGLLTRNNPLVKSSVPAVRNGFVQHDSNMINISVNPLSYDGTDDDSDKSPQLEMIPMNNNEQMVYSRLIQSADSSEMSSPCHEPSESQPMIASPEDSEILSLTQSPYPEEAGISLTNNQKQRIPANSDSNLNASSDEYT